MPAHRPRALRIRSGRALALLAVLALLEGCAVPPAPLAGWHPANPDAPVPPVAYRATPHVSQRPVEPATWSEQNDRVAPRPKP